MHGNVSSWKKEGKSEDFLFEGIIMVLHNPILVVFFQGSLLDNAPNYPVESIIKKGYFTLPKPEWNRNVLVIGLENNKFIPGPWSGIRAFLFNAEGKELLRLWWWWFCCFRTESNWCTGVESVKKYGQNYWYLLDNAPN